MAFHSNPFIQEELSHWCEEAIVNEKHALLLLGVPVNTDVSQIEETVQRVKALGRVRVRDTKVGPSPSSLIVLCECREVIDPTRMPIELQIGDEEETWKIVVSKKCETTGIGFADKFSSFLNGEGKTIKDVQELLSPLSSSAGSPESIIRAVGELLEKTVLPSSDTSAYRRLRIFSATIPTPSGEETMDNWIEQARLMITECECSEKEKRRRIVESLKGPALEIIKAVRFSSPDASALQYIEALESTFGTSESGEDLYFAFRLLRQNRGESLSEFLRRIEKSLTKVVQRGGLSPQMMDRTRVEQLIRGAVESDMMLLQLRLRERKEQPPTFLALLNEIREAEESETARHRINTTVKTVHFQEDDKLTLSIVKELKADIQELRMRLDESQTSVSVSSVNPEPKTKTDKKSFETQQSEVHMLHKQVKDLQQQLAVLSVSQSQPDRHVHAQKKSAPFTARRLSQKKDDYFCYRCGEDGHIATRCQAIENSAQVIQKLVRSLRKFKGGKENVNPNSSDDKQVCFSKKSQTGITGSSTLPKGLVGPASTVSVKINGFPCQALLDSGSQVTIVFDTWYKKYLPNVHLHPLTGLSIWGLSSSSYPYKGYIIVDVSFPATLTSVEETLSILALVCPEPQGPQQLPVIIGTNASFFQRLAALSQDSGAYNEVHALRIQTQNQEFCFSHQPCKEITDDLPDGKIKWMGPGTFTVPSRGERYAVCKVESEKPLRKEIFIVEVSSAELLPAGLFIPPMVLPSSALEVNNFRVLIHNETYKDISIPAGTVIAHVFPTDTVTVTQRVQTSTKTINPELFDFSESTIPAVWEQRLRQKLSE